MTAGDVVQSKGTVTGASTVTVLAITLASSVTPGNTVVVAIAPTTPVTSTPAGFSLVNTDNNGNYLYASSSASGSSWSFGFSGGATVAAIATEFVGAASFTASTYATSGSAGTAANSSPVAASAGQVALAYALYGSTSAVPAVSAWANGFTQVTQSVATSGGGFNLRAALATRTSAGGPESTTATFPSAVNWTLVTAVASFAVLTPLSTPVVTLGNTVNPTSSSASDGSQVVTWPAVANATSYEAWSTTKANPAQGDFVLVASGVTSPYQFVNLSNGTYSFGIKAKA